MAEPLLELDDVAVHFKVGSALAGGVHTLKAVDGVTFDVKPGECLGLVGESGCGKSTLALAIMGLIPPTHGHIALDGRDLAKRQRLETARTVQMVFQDPYASLNPRQTVRRTLADPLRLHGVTDRAEPSCCWRCSRAGRELSYAVTPRNGNFVRMMIYFLVPWTTWVTIISCVTLWSSAARDIWMF